MRHALAVVLSVGILGAATTPAGFHARETAAVSFPMRTWVSGTGNDANDCSRTAPCLTFAGAISKTAPNGEIDALDPGGFGPVTITKSITIDGNGSVAGVVADGTNGITVNAGNDDVITLRNLEIDGAGAGFNGVLFLNGKQLIVENTRIFGFQYESVEVGAGMTGAGNLVISNSTIGMTIGGGPGFGDGIHTYLGIATVSHSVIAGNGGDGLRAEGTSVINADSNVLTGNGVAVIVGTGATVRLSNNDVYGNLTGFACGGGTLASNGTNRKGNNTGGTAAACAPNATITQQ